MFSFTLRNIDFSHKLDYASSPKDEYGKHMHPFMEIIYFVSGDAQYNVEGERRKLKPGDCILIQAGKFHFAEVNRSVLYERYVLKFPENMFPERLKPFLLYRSPFYRLTNEEMNVFKSLDNYYESMNDEDMYIICQAKLWELLALLDNTKPASMKDTDISVVSKITKYIELHLEDNLTLTKMSEDLNYSESYISNCFKKDMHIPIMKYIRSKKIIHAHSLIQNGAKPQDVCERLNFNDYSTFYRQYLKVIGVSPSADK
jgi:AraC-like DNA-binding protein